MCSKKHHNMESFSKTSVLVVKGEAWSSPGSGCLVAWGKRCGSLQIPLCCPAWCWCQSLLGSHSMPAAPEDTVMVACWFDLIAPDSIYIIMLTYTHLLALTSSAPSSSFPLDHRMPLFPMTTMVTSREERSWTWKRSEYSEGSSISRFIRYFSLRLQMVALHSLNCWMNLLKRKRILFRVKRLYSWMRLRMDLGRKDL